MPTIEPCARLVLVKCTFIHSGVWERGHLHRTWWHLDGMYVARRIALIYCVSIDSSARCVILHMPWSRGAQIGVTSGRLCFGKLRPKIVGWSFLYKSLWHGGVIVSPHRTAKRFPPLGFATQPFTPAYSCLPVLGNSTRFATHCAMPPQVQQESISLSQELWAMLWRRIYRRQSTED